MKRSIIGTISFDGSGAVWPVVRPSTSSIGDEIAMHGGGQFDGDFDRLVVGERPELELRHGVPPCP